MEHFKEIEEFNIKMRRLEKLIFISRFFNNKRLILTCLEEETLAGKIIIKSILKYSHAKNEVTLTSDLGQNIEVLRTKIAKDWDIEAPVIDILDIIKINRKHKESPTEFMRKGKIIILDEEQNIEKIDHGRLKKTFDSIKIIKERFNSIINSKVNKN